MISEARTLHPADTVLNKAYCKCGQAFQRVAVHDDGRMYAYYCPKCDDNGRGNR